MSNIDRDVKAIQKLEDEISRLRRKIKKANNDDDNRQQEKYLTPTVNTMLTKNKVSSSKTKSSNRKSYSPDF